MESTLILILGAAVILAASYFFLIAGFGLLRKFVDHSSGALKGIFLILGVIATIWIVSNRDQSDTIVAHVKHWAFNVKDVNLFDLELK